MKENFQLLIGFDTETLTKESKQIFYSWQAFCPELKIKKFSTNKEEILDLFTFKTRGAYFICANAEFDISILSKILHNTGLKIEATYTKAKFISAKITDNQKHAWHIIDILNVFSRASVEKLGKMVNLPKLARPQYLGTRKPTSDEFSYFRQYALRDAQIAYLSAKMLVKEFGAIKPTLPSLTLSNFRKFNKNCFFWKQPRKDIHEKIRQAYHGGRVESFYRGSLFDNVYAYDVNSMYPSVMAYADFPDVNYLPIEKTSVNLENEGCALCEITQDCLLPPLCANARLSDDKVRLVFPNGKLKGWFTYPELRYLENHSYGKIVKVEYALEWKRRFKPFRNYILGLHSKKLLYSKQGDSRKEIYKLMLNSLYGKFGQNSEATQYEFINGLIQKLASKTSFAKHTNFILASYVTSCARLRLHKRMMRNNGEDILYCDTDGFLTTKNNYSTNEKLGGLESRSGIDAIRYTTIIRPKSYIIDDTVRFKGLPIPINGFDLRRKILDGNVSFTKKIMLRPRQAFRMHYDSFESYDKTISFSLAQDSKRLYKKELNNLQLVNEFTTSLPIELKVY